MDAFPVAEVKEIEIALLDLRYSHTRVMQKDRLLSLAVSLDMYGQMWPVITAARYVLVDGYRRVEALKICGRDTVMAQVWDCEEDRALLRVLSVQRKWDAVEEAAIIREVISGHALTQAQVARMLCEGSELGRSKAEPARLPARRDPRFRQVRPSFQLGRIESIGAVGARQRGPCCSHKRLASPGACLDERSYGILRPL